jgi:hypothetical protein
MLSFVNVELVNTSFIISNKIIACYLSVYLYCLFCLGYVVGGAHP